MTLDNLQWGPLSEITNPGEFHGFFPPRNLTLDVNTNTHVNFHWDPSEVQI
jgi:hypothetical protein